MKEDFLQELFNDPEYIADMEREQREYEEMMLWEMESLQEKKNSTSYGEEKICLHQNK